jgi:branched-subunit amino acid transport protein
MRVIPSLIMKKPIQNRFVQSFLYYVPYVTLAVMTFPVIVQATDEPLAGAAALIVGVIAAWLGADLIYVAAACCVTVFVLELIIGMM